jgi:phosphosulfolactate synthase
MISQLLDLPARAVKPRHHGLTMVIDGGMPTHAFEDAVSAVADHIDVVKLGWGTAMVTPDLDKKLSLLRIVGIEYYLGGTLFEKFVAQDRFDAYMALCHELRTGAVEVSNGTIPMSNTAKCAYIRKCSEHFRVISEVGYKDSDRSLHLAPSQWIDCIGEDLEPGRAGAAASAGPTASSASV